MNYEELTMEKASEEIRNLFSSASSNFNKEWDGLIHFPTNEKNELVGPAINESALDLLDDEHRKKLKEIKEKYFGK